MIQVIFSRRHHIGSVALRTFLWSPWSHCGIVTNEGTVIQATADQGVIETPLVLFEEHSSDWAIVTFDADYGQVVAAARSQLGKKYDWTGCLGIPLHRTWKDADAWFCSELVAWALEQGRCKLYRVTARRITPQHLWMLERPIKIAAVRVKLPQ